LLDLLTVSAPPGEDKRLRALEVTVIAHNEVVPWHYPARRELQFGEWLRKNLLAGIFEPAVLDIDLAILLQKARQHSIALLGPAAEELFEQVPKQDFFKALTDTLKQWNSFVDWSGDERNIVLTLARIWYSAATGSIVPKDVAADWVLERLPIEYQPILHEARQAYLGHSEDNLFLLSNPPSLSYLKLKNVTFMLNFRSIRLVRVCTFSDRFLGSKLLPASGVVSSHPSALTRVLARRVTQTVGLWQKIQTENKFSDITEQE
jgi:hypothetical protein